MSARPAPDASAARDDEAIAARYRDHLLGDCGAASLPPAALGDEHPARIWARSGLMALCGDPDGAPQMCPLPIGACADGALAALATLAPRAALGDLRGAALLAERAALTGLQRRGAQSAGGACRLLDAADGRFALSLARDDDWSLLPAWLEDEAADWDAVARLARTRALDALVERGRLLGLAIAPSREADGPLAWQRIVAGPALADARRADPAGDARAPLVVDLSSLWAGPLCTHLLQRCGATVLKVESTQRPDGARRGATAFFDLLNAGKRSIALDLQTARGRTQLLALLRRADIVIEASRPRALQQMGIDAAALVAERPGLTWIGIHGYGRDEPQAQWIAYGDDAGVAAGLSAIQQRASGAALFVGDAIADPLTGLHAALAAWCGWRNGASRLVSLALRDVVAHVAQFDRPADDDVLRARQQAWTQMLAADDVRAPSARAACAAAPALGADTQAVLHELHIAC